MKRLLRRATRRTRAALVTTFVSGTVTVPGAFGQTRPSCESCHAELEFLRQHVETLAEAEALVVSVTTLGQSAHAGMSCASCHTGFRAYPHPAASSSRPCTECHAAPTRAWAEGMHGLEGGARCMDCHGTHDIAPPAALATPEGIARVRSGCAACHYAPGNPSHDTHERVVSCVGCHEPHRTLPAEDERARTYVLNQAVTCGACHESAERAWSADAHGAAAPALAQRGGAAARRGSHTDPPACSACHGSHEMLAPSAAEFDAGMVERCAVCHEGYAESFADSYHGQASTLGSKAVATCQDCHGSHGIYPASDARSSVGEGRLLETCRSCHERATAGFVGFQPHADHRDRDRYPYVYWSYRLMTALLIGVFSVFGAHTALWLARLGLNSLRGTAADAAPRRADP